jgi:AcrR family transcriptional regulator
MRLSRLRESQRLMTQRTIQAHAMRLFEQEGYDQTPITDIARAAGVSPMTLYRHFPTKEDLVLTDEYDPLIAQRIAARPPGEPVMQRIGATLVEEVAKVLSGDGQAGSESPAALLLGRLRLVSTTPALRARRFDSQYATQLAIVDALRGDSTDPQLQFQLSVAAGACLAAMSAALMRWADEDGRPDLPQLMSDALAIVSGGDAGE